MAAGIVVLGRVLRQAGTAGLLLFFASGAGLAQSHAAIPKAPDSLQLASGSIEALVHRVARSVVQVVVSGYRPVGSTPRGGVSLGHGRVIGSGVIVEAPGFVLTNAHVVAGAERIQVIVEADGAETLGHQTSRTLDARLAGVSEELDLALLQIDASDVPVLPLADYDAVRQGELVFAFGSPDGLRNSVTMGMVSSVARQVSPDSPLVYVQTDASVNPGNSGGPLVDASGHVVGINTFIQSASGGSEGLGFALPSAFVAFAFPQLRDHGYLQRGVIGLTVQTVTPLIASGLRLPADAALIAANVASGSPADDAGIRDGDIISSLDGAPVSTLTPASLYLRLYALRAGQNVRVEVQRGGVRTTLTAAAVANPNDCNQQTLIDVSKSLIEPLGIFAVPMDAVNDGWASDGAAAPRGVLVSARVETARPAVSLERGDVIREVNGAQVSTPAELREAIAGIPLRGAVVLQVEREGLLGYVAFERE